MVAAFRCSPELLTGRKRDAAQPGRGVFDGGGRRRYYPPRLKASGAGMYARNKHSLFHARRGRIVTKRHNFRQARAVAFYRLFTVAER